MWKGKAKIMTNTPESELREKLAAIEHERWADWQKYQHSKMLPEERFEEGSHFKTGNMVMPKGSYQHWESQISRPYAELSDKEKASDMEQVDRYWPLIEAYVQAKVVEARTDERENMKFIDYDGQETHKPFLQYRYTGGDLLLNWEDRTSQLKAQTKSGGKVSKEFIQKQRIEGKKDATDFLRESRHD